MGGSKCAHGPYSHFKYWTGATPAARELETTEDASGAVEANAKSGHIIDNQDSTEVLRRGMIINL